MSADPVTAVGNAVSEFFGTVRPFVTDYLQQKYENEHKDRIKEINDILSEKDEDKRADRLQSYFKRVYGDAGETFGGVGEYISVPLAFVSASAEIASLKIKNDEMLAAMRFK